MYELLLAPKEELRFCFRLSGGAAERCGAIGYLRADFGRGGKEFYTTWFDSQPHLKTYSNSTIYLQYNHRETTNWKYHLERKNLKLFARQQSARRMLLV
jgi:hypothetical protein